MGRTEFVCPEMLKDLRKHLQGGRFQHVSQARSRTMRSIRASGNKTTEIRLRMGFVRRGIRGWLVRPAGIEGCPDFFFPRHRLAVFADGCFWHGCPTCGHLPGTNREFWRAKFARRRRRDREVNGALRGQGFTVERFWEHAIREQLDRCLARVARWLHRH
jgi:DNA mismatch endonuclease (patch repair protein)